MGLVSLGGENVLTMIIMMVVKFCPKTKTQVSSTVKIVELFGMQTVF